MKTAGINITIQNCCDFLKTRAAKRLLHRVSRLSLGLIVIKQSKVRKVLDSQVAKLNDVIADIDVLLTEMGTDFYRVTIFGSARLAPDTKLYQRVYDLAFELASRGVDIVTGGGPGLMEAANKGAQSGCNHSRSIGLAIQLPFESDANPHLDVKRQHRRFSSRLDEFMRISHAVVVTPGGIGTILELFYTWQLLQVEHITERPIFLLGNMWKELKDWIERWPLKDGLLSKTDYDLLIPVESVEDVISHLEPRVEAFRQKRLREKQKK